MIVEDTKLYNQVKKEADKIYKKSSAYKSGWIIKRYKQLGGTFIEDHKPKPLKRWFKEQWSDISNNPELYPTYRPFKRISKKTPLTVDEIDPKQMIDQIQLKQIIQGDFNLPKFKKRKD